MICALMIGLSKYVLTIRRKSFNWYEFSVVWNEEQIVVNNEGGTLDDHCAEYVWDPNIFREHAFHRRKMKQFPSQWVNCI